MGSRNCPPCVAEVRPRLTLPQQGGGRCQRCRSRSGSQQACRRGKSPLDSTGRATPMCSRQFILEREGCRTRGTPAGMATLTRHSHAAAPDTSTDGDHSGGQQQQRPLKEQAPADRQSGRRLRELHLGAGDAAAELAAACGTGKKEMGIGTLQESTRMPPVVQSAMRRGGYHLQQRLNDYQQSRGYIIGIGRHVVKQNSAIP